MDVWNYILGYRNTLKSVFETWVVHIPFNCNPGYYGIPNGVYEVTCQTNETWDSPASDCESKFTKRIQRFFSTMIIIHSNKNATDKSYEKTTDL